MFFVSKSGGFVFELSAILRLQKTCSFLPKKMAFRMQMLSYMELGVSISSGYFLVKL